MKWYKFAEKEPREKDFILALGTNTDSWLFWGPYSKENNGPAIIPEGREYWLKVPKFPKLKKEKESAPQERKEQESDQSEHKD